VLELRAQLELTEAQRTRMETLFEAMKAKTIALGERLIALETELDRLFAGRTATVATLADAAAAIGMTQGMLRAAHLKFHLSTVEVLTPEQIRRYDGLRGYSREPQLAE
jgi:Spy/CpxP family protein refolding chaperone